MTLVTRKLIRLLRTYILNIQLVGDLYMLIEMLLNYAFIYRGSQRYILFLSVGVKHCNLFLLPVSQGYLMGNHRQSALLYGSCIYLIIES